MIRHKRPYCCTFECEKSDGFGSKDDWKRHESQKHFPKAWPGEVFLCGEKVERPPAGGRGTESGDSVSVECKQMLASKALLLEHLASVHSVHKKKKAEKKAADARLAPAKHLAFWCGFCRKTICSAGNAGPPSHDGSDQSGLANGDELTSVASFLRFRSDHIDDHFMGRTLPKMDISQWERGALMHPHFGKAIALVTPEDGNGAAGRMDSGHDGSDMYGGGTGNTRAQKRPSNDADEGPGPGPGGRGIAGGSIENRARKKQRYSTVLWVCVSRFSFSSHCVSALAETPIYYAKCNCAARLTVFS